MLPKKVQDVHRIIGDLIKNAFKIHLERCLQLVIAAYRPAKDRNKDVEAEESDYKRVYREINSWLEVLNENYTAILQAPPPIIVEPSKKTLELSQNRDYNSGFAHKSLHIATSKLKATLSLQGYQSLLSNLDKLHIMISEFSESRSKARAEECLAKEKMRLADERSQMMENEILAAVRAREIEIVQLKARK